MNELEYLSYLPFFLSYAEMHYSLKFIKPKYFRREPEIIADVPIRIIKPNKLPVLIIIKDSHLFPIVLKKVNVKISEGKQVVIKDFFPDIELNKPYYSDILHIDLSEFRTERDLNISVTFSIIIDNENKEVINDNYAGLEKTPFLVYYADQPLPYPKGWFAGEPHYHSNYTSDQVEFGADIKAARIMAKASGLTWFFVTDHSYDLDDSETNYLENDPEFPKWEKMKNDVKSNDAKDFRIIFGEEVSIGNSEGKNVHLLAINHNEFIEGHGDSAEKWFRNKPKTYLKELRKRSKGQGARDKIQGKNTESLFIAAHPNEKIPFLQKLTLRRGNWQLKDYLQSKIKFLQIINNSDLSSIERSVNYWRNLLLQGHKFFILAGNDAHGNFNVMRQIKIPYWKLFASDHQVFGKFQTVFYCSENDPIKGIKNGKIIVGNGPFLDFWLEFEDNKFEIGSILHQEKAKLVYESAVSQEFGEITSIRLFIGDINLKKEKKIKKPLNNSFQKLPQKGYLRMSLSTSKMGKVFTNPIWIEN